MDKTCPVCGMKGNIKTHGHYFCSENCIKKYEKENDLSEKDEYCPGCNTKKGTSWYKEKITIITTITLVVLLVSFYVKQLNPFFNAFIDYLELIWWAILLGFILGGVIDYFIPREYIKKYLSRHQKRTILYSIVFGFLMSACSHGMLAISIELYKKGASTSAVIAFLMASPWANLPITFLLMGFFGLKAFYIIVSALIIATVTGLIFQALERRGLVECKSCKMGEDIPVLQDFSITDDIKKRWKNYEFNTKNNFNALKGTLNGS